MKEQLGRARRNMRQFLRRVEENGDVRGLRNVRMRVTWVGWVRCTRF